MQDFNLNNSDQYFDVLKEIGNIGAGNATTALAQLLQCKVDMKVPQVRLLNFSEVGAAIGGEEQLMTGVYLLVEGDITGSMMFLLEETAAHNLVSKLMNVPQSEGNFSDMELSALKEIGNIIVASYLNSLSKLTNLRITPFMYAGTLGTLVILCIRTILSIYLMLIPYCSSPNFTTMY